MGRIMGIDFGLKRTGLSVTDPMRIIVSGLETLETKKLFDFLARYTEQEPVDEFVVGYPFMDETWGDPAFKKQLDQFIRQLRKMFPDKPVQLQDERYTTSEARDVIRQRGYKQKKRQDKRQLDQTSAILILQTYLGHI